MLELSLAAPPPPALALALALFLATLTAVALRLGSSAPLSDRASLPPLALGLGAGLLTISWAVLGATSPEGPGTTTLAPLGAGTLLLLQLTGALLVGVAALTGALAPLSGSRSRRRVRPSSALLVSAAALVLAALESVAVLSVAPGAPLAFLAAALLALTLALLAPTSVFAQVLAVVLSTILVVSISALVAVGSALASTQADAALESAARVATSSQASIAALETTSAQLASVLTLCPGPAPASGEVAGCSALLSQLRARPSTFALRVEPDGSARELRLAAPLEPGIARALSTQGVVGSSLAPGAPTTPTSALVALPGTPDRLFVIGVAPGPPISLATPPAQRVPSYVVVHGVEITDALASEFAASAGGFQIALLSAENTSELVAISGSRSEDASALVRSLTRAAPLDPRELPTLENLGGSGEDRVSSDDRALLLVRTLYAANGTPVATLAVSVPQTIARAGELAAARTLFLTTLVLSVLAGVLALTLTRLLVAPLRALTESARLIEARSKAWPAQSLAQEETPDPAPSASIELVPAVLTPALLARADELGALAGAFASMDAAVAQSQEQLTDQARKLATILDALADGVLLVDSTGVIAFANPAAHQLLGPDAPVLGAPVLERVLLSECSPEGAPSNARGDADARGEAMVFLELDSLRGRGPSNAFLIANAFLAGAPPRPIAVSLLDLPAESGALLVLRDRTPEEALERAKGEFLSNVSHELRTPLTPVLGYADLLRRRGSSLAPEKLAEIIERIHGGALSLRRIVDLVVDVAALDSGRVESAPVLLDAREVLTAARARLEARLLAGVAGPSSVGGSLSGNAPTQLSVSVSRGAESVWADRRWLEKLLDELLDNAAKFGSDPIKLTATGEAGRVRLMVSDRGPGLSPTRPDLLDAFSQSDGSATRKVGGLGLGLALATRIAALLDGSLVVAAPRKGASIGVELPRAPRPSNSVKDSA